MSSWWRNPGDGDLRDEPGAAGRLHRPGEPRPCRLFRHRGLYGGADRPEYEAANLWFVLVAGAAGAAAFFIGLFVLRTKGIYFIMVTLAFAQMAYYIFHDTALGRLGRHLPERSSRDASLFGWMPFNLDEPTAPLLLHPSPRWWRCSCCWPSRCARPFGRVLAGIHSNEHRMKSLGYATFRYKLAAFTLAGAAGGVAGFLYAVLFGFVTPDYLSWHQSGNVLLMVILGGLGSLAGAVAGASPSSACRRCSRTGPSTGNC